MEYKINKINYSKREIEIISCMCNGCSSKIIAGILNISPYTVDSHIKNIKGKMNCFSRNAIVNFVENSEEYSNIRAKYAELKQLQVYSEREAINAYSYVRKKIGISVLIKCAISFMVVLIIELTVSYLVKQPNLSYEIQLPNEHILLPRKDIIGKIKKIFSSGDKLNFVVLLGEAGIDKAAETLRGLQASASINGGVGTGVNASNTRMYGSQGQIDEAQIYNYHKSRVESVMKSLGTSERNDELSSLARDYNKNIQEMDSLSKAMEINQSRIIQAEKNVQESIHTTISLDDNLLDDFIVGAKKANPEMSDNQANMCRLLTNLISLKVS